MDIQGWLRSLELEHYAQAFVDNDIDASVLRLLTEADLSAMGVRSVEQRHRLLLAIAELPDPTIEFPSVPPAPDEPGGGDRLDARSGSAPLRMFGRDHELALLIERWAQVESDQGLGVLIVGEAGIGKSRLVRALVDSLPEDAAYRASYRCSPHFAESALWPVIASIRRASGIDEGDSDEVALHKLEAMPGSTREAMQWLTALMGYGSSQGSSQVSSQASSQVSPQERRTRTLDMLVGWVLRLAAQKPVLLLVEDAHWVDPTTLEYLVRCLDEIASTRVMVLLTCRPDNLPRLDTHPLVQRLVLNRLSRKAVESIVADVGGQRLAATTVERIVAQTDGVPLFVEEMTKAVLDTGSAAIPPTLRGSLMARLGRSAQVKEIAQIAACIGREFDQELLAAVARRPVQELAQAMDRLTAAELVYRHSSRRNVKYVFKHALVQEAAYESLAQAERKEMHARVYDALCARQPPGAPELRGRHAAKAGRAGDAIACWQEAARASVAKSAYEEAARYFSYAIDLVTEERLDSASHDTELRLLCDMGESQMAAQGYGAATTMRTFERAHSLLDDSHDMLLRSQVMNGLWAGHFAWGRGDKALALGRELMRATAQQPDPAAELSALRMLGATEIDMGRLGEAQVHLQRAAMLHDMQGQRSGGLQLGVEPGVAARCFLARAVFLLGDLREARKIMSATLAAASTSGGSPHTQACARHHAALQWVLARDAARAEREARQLLEFTRRHHLRMWEAHAQGDLGWALLEQGAHAQAASEFEQSLARLGGASATTPYFRAGLAQALVAGNRVGEARVVIDAALTELGSHGWCEAEVWRVRGEVCAAEQGDDADDAAHCFERGLSIARTQQARAWELRVALSLARLRLAQGRGDLVASLLSPLCDALAEGFDTADLREGRSLLRGAPA